MTKDKALEILESADHCFFYEKEAKEIAKAFGLQLKNLSEQEDTRSQFKGLTLGGINPKTGKEFKEGDTVKGVDASLLAERICSHLKLECKGFFGRGSQLRECVGALKKAV